MPQAREAFADAIGDAEHLLQHFNELNTLPPPPETEVLQRAGLVMAMTAWETYVEDRVSEACNERLNAYVKNRGEVMHRSRPIEGGGNGHAVKKEEFERVISFLKNLVEPTERELPAPAQENP